MPRNLSVEQKRALAECVKYYRELGIYDFYRRGAPAGAVAVADDILRSGPEDLAAAPANLNGVQTTYSVKAPESRASDPAEALRQIREDLGDCTRCRLHKQGRKQIVFGVGNPYAELMFVGEGPGADEDEQGEPFVGRAGQLLNKMIEAMGLKRSDVYIANVVKCRPPSNRTPEPDECTTCSPFLLRQIDVIRPKAIVALGATASKALLQINENMATMRSRSYEFRGSKLFVTYHPAYLLRDPRQKAETWKDLQQVMKYLGMPLPQRSAE